MVVPVVDFWRGTPVAFPRAKVLPDDSPELASTLRRVAKGFHRPTAIDLFSGAGGLSLGLEKSGFDVLMAVDSDPASCETHANAFKGVMVQADLSQPSDLLRALSSAGINRVDLVAGGPPCQPFSRAGRSKIRSLEKAGTRGPDTRPSLWTAFTRFVTQLSPELVLIENVPDMVLWNDGQTVRQICGWLEAEGYEVHAAVLECWKFGVPQHRQRLFVVGSRNPGFEWPQADEDLVTLRDAIGDLPRVGPAQHAEWLPYSGPPKTAFQKRMRARSNGKINDHITRAVRDDDLEAFQMLKEGLRYRDLPGRLQRYRSDIFDDKYTILDWAKLSRSITAHLAKDGYWYIHPSGKRMLSIREAARLQTFPDWFRFAGYPSARLRQIGNAVPPEMARRLGRRMLRTLNQTRSSRGADFRASEFRRRLLAWHGRKGRDFPWRRTQDPWLVFMAEMLLRRTRADAVAAIWPQLVKRFHRPADVVNRSRELRTLLYPLGLRWRVNNLIAAARQIMKDHKGRVPKTREGLIALPGVGDYVADAVMAFALGHPVVLVDSNTARIASRVFGLTERFGSLRNLNLRASVARLGGVRPPTPNVNLALMDLGGTICTPTKPKCSDCPVLTLCTYGSLANGSKLLPSR